MTYFQSVKKSQLYEIIRHVEIFTPEIPFEEIKYPEVISSMKMEKKFR